MFLPSVKLRSKNGLKRGMTTVDSHENVTREFDFDSWKKTHFRRVA